MYLYLAMAKEKSSLLLFVSSLLFTVILAHSLKDLPRYNGFKIHTFSEVALLVFSGLQQGKGKNEDIWSWYCSFWRLWWISWTHDNFTDLGLKNGKKSFLKEHFYFSETVLSQYISSISIHLVKKNSRKIRHIKIRMEWPFKMDSNPLWYCFKMGNTDRAQLLSTSIHLYNHYRHDTSQFEKLSY